MLTTTAAMPTAARPGTREAQKVVLVNGSSRLLALLEPALEAGRYDVSFVASHEGAYGHIKRVQPNLVILCIRFDDPEGLQILSMLKLDADTRAIPVVTFLAEFDAAETDEDATDAGDEEILVPPAPVSMN